MRRKGEKSITTRSLNIRNIHLQKVAPTPKIRLWQRTEEEMPVITRAQNTTSLHINHPGIWMKNQLKGTLIEKRNYHQDHKEWRPACDHDLNVNEE